MAAGAGEDELAGVFGRASGPVDAVGAERLEHIRHGSDAPFDGDVMARETARIALAVPAFVMGGRDAFGAAHQGGAAIGEDRLADRHMRPHHRHLLIGEAARLLQNEVGDADLADVVHRRGGMDGLALLGVETQPLGDDLA